MPRSLHEIASEIRRDWRKPYFRAVPYLNAMSTLGSITENYGADSGKSIVAHFLSNAGSWKGIVARRVKSELRTMAK